MAEITEDAEVQVAEAQWQELGVDSKNVLRRCRKRRAWRNRGHLFEAIRALNDCTVALIQEIKSWKACVEEGLRLFTSDVSDCGVMLPTSCEPDVHEIVDDRES
eukprot:4746440-Karenia_brevis.AAC.1